MEPEPSTTTETPTDLPITTICETGTVILDVVFLPSLAPRQGCRATPKKNGTPSSPISPISPIRIPPPTKGHVFGKKPRSNGAVSPIKTCRPSLDRIKHLDGADDTKDKEADAPTPNTPNSTSNTPNSTPNTPNPKPNTPYRMAYRVDPTILGKESPYFHNLLLSTSFSEGRLVTDRLAQLDLSSPLPLDPSALPRVRITDDDTATFCAIVDRVPALTDLLYALHGLKPASIQDPSLAPPSAFSHAITVAILADKYDCLSSVRLVVAAFNPRWPNIPSLAPSYEETIRKAILLAYYSGNIQSLLKYTQRLILFGSRRWSALAPPEDDEDDPKAMAAAAAAWWHLPDGLERELQYRRECVLNTIASVPRHFINAYTTSLSSPHSSRCSRGYDSSPACDAFQFGQFIRFLTRRGLAYLYDFGPSSYDSLPDPACVPVSNMLEILREAPSYQIDSNHTNCGPSTRMRPITSFIQNFLASVQALGISLDDWRLGPGKRNSWETNPSDEDERPFVFTRAIRFDQRIWYPEVMAGNSLTRRLFTATSWEWTADW